MSIIDDLIPEGSGRRRSRQAQSFEIRMEFDGICLCWWTLYDSGVDLLVRLNAGTVEVFLHGTIPNKFKAGATIYHVKIWQDIFTKHGYCPKTIKDSIELAVKRGSGTQTSLF